MASVEFEHVDKVFPDGTRALADCTLRIEDGELVVVVGPSGCGKSTLLRLVAGLEEVSAGTVRIGERVVNELSPQERNVAMVFQDYALYPHLSARGNLEFPLRMRRQPRTGTTMIYVTHDQVEAMTLGDRVAVLDRGRLQQVAPPRDLYDRPANAFVAGFIGNPPMNLFPTRLSVDDRGRVVMDLGGQPAPVSGAPAHGAAVTAGVRPESLRLVPAGAAEGAVRAVVQHLQCLGHAA